MEKPLYPSYNMRITQGYNIGTHIDSFAIDDAGKDQSIEPIRAPFTGIIKKIYSADANEVWLESTEPVEYPDGTVDYMTIMFAHSNNVSNLFVGKLIAQGENFYSEGTKGNATGNHCHIECGKGKFSGSGWYKNNNGYYSINNGKKPEDCLWLDDNVNVISSNNYNFKKIPTEPKPSVPDSKEEDNNTPTDDKEELKAKLIFTCPKKALYGIYLKEGQKIYLE